MGFQQNPLLAAAQRQQAAAAQEVAYKLDAEATARLLARRVAAAKAHARLLSPSIRARAIQGLCQAWPAREAQLRSLVTHLCPLGPAAAAASSSSSSFSWSPTEVRNEAAPPPLLIRGPPGTGKRGVLRGVLKAFRLRHVWIDCDRVVPRRAKGAYTAQQLSILLFDAITAQLINVKNNDDDDDGDDEGGGGKPSFPSLAASASSSASSSSSSSSSSIPHAAASSSMSEDVRQLQQGTAAAVSADYSLAENAATVSTGMETNFAKAEVAESVAAAIANDDSPDAADDSSEAKKKEKKEKDAQEYAAAAAVAAAADKEEEDKQRRQQQQQQQQQGIGARIGSRRRAASGFIHLAHTCSSSSNNRGRGGGDGDGEFGPPAGAGATGGVGVGGGGARCRDIHAFVAALEVLLPPEPVFTPKTAATTVAPPPFSGGGASSSSSFSGGAVDDSSTTTTKKKKKKKEKGTPRQHHPLPPPPPPPKLVLVLAHSERLLESDVSSAAEWVLPLLSMAPQLLIDAQRQLVRTLSKRARKELKRSARQHEEQGMGKGGKEAQEVQEKKKSRGIVVDMDDGCDDDEGDDDEGNDDDRDEGEGRVSTTTITSTAADKEASSLINSLARNDDDRDDDEGALASSQPLLSAPPASSLVSWTSWSLQLCCCCASDGGSLMGVGKFRDGRLLGGRHWSVPIGVSFQAYSKPELRAVVASEVRRFRRPHHTHDQYCQQYQEQYEQQQQQQQQRVALQHQPGEKPDEQLEDELMVRTQGGKGAAATAASAAAASAAAAARLSVAQDCEEEECERLVVDSLVQASGCSSVRVLRRACLELCGALEVAKKKKNPPVNSDIRSVLPLATTTAAAAAAATASAAAATSSTTTATETAAEQQQQQVLHAPRAQQPQEEEEVLNLNLNLNLNLLTRRSLDRNLRPFLKRCLEGGLRACMTTTDFSLANPPLLVSNPHLPTPLRNVKSGNINSGGGGAKRKVGGAYQQDDIGFGSKGGGGGSSSSSFGYGGGSCSGGSCSGGGGDDDRSSASGGGGGGEGGELKEAASLLPPRARLLLVAAFIASHTKAEHDLSLFTPASRAGGKRSKRQKNLVDTGGDGGEGGSGGGALISSSLPGGPVVGFFRLKRLLSIFGVLWAEHGPHATAAAAAAAAASGGRGGGSRGGASAQNTLSNGQATAWKNEEEWGVFSGGFDGSGSGGEAGPFQVEGGEDSGSGIDGPVVLRHVATLVKRRLLHYQAKPSASSSSSEGGLSAPQLRCVAPRALVVALAAHFGLQIDRYLR